MNQNKTSFITYIDKIEKAYLKAVKTIYRPHFERRGPERKDIFKVLKNNITNTSFVLSNNLLNRAKQIADLINLKKRYPNHYILEILFKLDDLLAFIVNGYYSTDLQSYSERLSEFFDLVKIFNEVVKGQIHDNLYWDGSKVMDYIDTKRDLFDATRDMFRTIFLTRSCSDLQEFQSRYHSESYFTIRIVLNKLQIIVRKEKDEPLNFYELADNFNDKKYLFKLNLKKILKDEIEQQEWYKDYLSKYYFSLEVVDFPDSLKALERKKSTDQARADLNQFYSKNSNDKNMLKKDIFKRIEDNSEVDYLLAKTYLNHLTNKEFIQILKPLIKLLNYYKNELHNNRSDKKFYSFRDGLLKGYFALWRSEKNLEKHGLRFDGFYHNFYYYIARRNRKKEKVEIHTDLKLYADGTIKLGKLANRFDEAQGRYIYSSNKISFFLSDQKEGSPYFLITIYEGIIYEDEIDISTLYGSTLIHLPDGKYKFIVN